MKLLKPLLVAAAALAASQAQAVTSFSYAYTASPTGAYAAPAFTDGFQATERSDSLTNLYLKPLGDVSTYLVVSSQPTGTEGKASIAVGASSYSFLWGSPDAFNYVDVYSSANSFETFTGSHLLSQFTMASNMSGDNANTGLFTITATGGDIDHLVLRSQGVAFEIAAPVPEPETYALMLAGLGALVFMSRRKRA